MSDVFDGFKTIGFNILIAVFGVIETLNWVDLVPPEYVGPVMLALGLVGAWLRTRTKGPMAGISISIAKKVPGVQVTTP